MRRGGGAMPWEGCGRAARFVRLDEEDGGQPQTGEAQEGAAREDDRGLSGE